MSKPLFQMPEAKLVEAYYADPFFYEFHHEDYVQDIDYYVGLAEEFQDRGPILELGCGTGRLTLPMAYAGAEVVAVDLNPALLEHMETKLQAKGNKELKQRVYPRQADILELDLERRFPLVLLPFNTLQHFHTMNEILGVMACVKRHLEPEGLFVLDVATPDIEYLADAGGRRSARETLLHPHDGTPWYFQERHEYDATHQVNYAFHIYRKVGKNGRAIGKETVMVLKQRQFFPQELDFILQAAGFQIEQKWGDFEGSLFEGHHDVQVYECFPEWV